MKNSTWALLLCILFNSFASTAGNRPQNLQVQNTTTSASKSIGQTNQLNYSSPFYSEDFAGGLPSGWRSLDSSGNGNFWHYTNSPAYNTTDSLNPIGTSASNGYMIFNSDSPACNNCFDNADLISDSINCVGHPSVHLTFNEFLIHYNDTATVLVSNDGTTWTEFHNTSAGLGQFSSTPNPNYNDIDISSVAANQPKVYIRFNYRANYSYYWMIDDVSLYEAAAVDVALSGINAPHTSCTLLTSTTQVKVKIYNNGGATLNGPYNVSYIADGGSPVTENLTQSITVGSNYVYTFTATADFSMPGTHSLETYISLAGDTNQTNDTLRTTIFNGPHVVDASTSYHMGFEANEDFSGYSSFDGNGDTISLAVVNSGAHTGTSCVSISSASADDWYFTTCLDLADTIFYDLTYFYKTNSSSTQAYYEVQIGNSQSIIGMTDQLLPFTLVGNINYAPGSIQFHSPTSGTFYIGFHVTGADSSVGFRLDDINLFPDSGLGMTELKRNLPLSVYPNPSSGIVYLNSNQSSASGYTVQVMNSIGNLVSSKITDTLVNYEINLGGEASGIYLVRIISENGIYTRKISISHQ